MPYSNHGVNIANPPSRPLSKLTRSTPILDKIYDINVSFLTVKFLSRIRAHLPP